MQSASFIDAGLDAVRARVQASPSASTDAARKGRAHVRPAAAADVALLAENLRPADRRELDALEQEPYQAVARSVALSLEPLAAVGADGRLIALFGVGPCVGPGSAAGREGAPAVGAPWMLATPGLETAAKPFLRQCRGWIDHIGRPFEMLANCVDARNTVHIRWLRWCGFSFLRRLPVGPKRLSFLEFVRIRPTEPVSTPPLFSHTLNERN